MKRIFLFLVVILLMVTACTSSDTQEPDVQEPDTAADTADTAPDADTSEPDSSTVDVIKVGALYPLTGPDAGWAGDPYIKSHQMAIDEINAAGGIACLGGAKLELVKGDTEGTAEAGNSETELFIFHIA